MQQFAIDAGGFGSLGSFYYYGYAGMQIPLAIMIARYSPRYIMCSCAVLCGIAMTIFSYTTNWYLAYLSHCLIGAGAVAGFLGVSKVIAEWFPAYQYAKITSYSLTMSVMAAVHGSKLMNLVLANYHWQKVVIILAGISIIIGVSAALLLRFAGQAAS